MQKLNQRLIIIIIIAVCLERCIDKLHPDRHSTQTIRQPQVTQAVFSSKYVTSRTTAAKFRSVAKQELSADLRKRIYLLADADGPCLVDWLIYLAAGATKQYTEHC